MHLAFSVTGSTITSLWDFGWFDVTRFKVQWATGDDRDWMPVLRGSLRDPISRRSFCTSPDAWGNGGELHGPFHSEKLAAEWYRPVSLARLQRRVEMILEDREFTTPPSREQRAPIDAWLDAARTRGDDAFVLEAPVVPGLRVEWDDVWILFHEFVCLSPNREEMTVAVIGYD